MAYLLDTNILIYLMKDMGAVRQRLATAKDSNIKLCTPTAWELLVGAKKSTNPDQAHQKVRLILSRFDVLPFDLNAAESAAIIRKQLESQGTPIGPIDTQIAAIAQSHGLTLVTRNLREFSRVQGLVIENWFEPSPS
jgi:tRNA(fMet)-specific endonuclease VapC